MTVLPNPSVNLAIGGYALATRTPMPIQYMEVQTSPENSFIIRRRSDLMQGDSKFRFLSHFHTFNFQYCRVIELFHHMLACVIPYISLLCVKFDQFLLLVISFILQETHLS